MSKAKYTIPDLILLGGYSGNFSLFNEAVYQIFRRDFIQSKPIFRGKRLGLKLYPIVDGKEYTYYHFTHDGDVETERIPNLRRMERIRFPKSIIDNSLEACFKVWRNKRGSSDRILLYCESETYLVVLEDRRNYILPWTAYYVENEHRRQKLLREYEDYIKAEAASH